MARRRRRQGLRITPLGYIVLGLIVAVMLIGVYFIIWSLGSNRQEGQGNLSSGSVSITPTPSLAPVVDMTPTPSLAPTQAPTQASTNPPETPAPTPKPDDTPIPDVKTPSPSQVQSAVDGKLTTSGVVLRKGPSGNYDILGKYSEGTQLKVYAAEEEYYFVLIVKENKYGYMAKKFIEKSGLLPGETATPAPDLPDGVVAGTVSSSVVALRNVPSTENNTPFGQIERGVNVYVYYETAGFFYIEVAATGTKGYAKADFISVEDRSSVPARTPAP